MNYCEAMEFLNSSSKFGMKLGLERTTKLLELLGDPHKGIKFIHIAGTNGKGSTTAMISSILSKAGYKVGMFTSPFIEAFEERVQVGGENIPKERVAALMERVKKASEELSEEYDDVTYFEIVTALGFLYFKECDIDLGVIEVGLGGRYDATNVIEPILTVITSISFDHTHILGDTIEKIAYEKAGIIKEGTPLVLYPVVEEAARVITDVALEKNAEIKRVFQENISIERIVTSSGERDAYQVIKLKDKRMEYKLPLVGEHQSMNSAVAVESAAALEKLGFKIREEDIIIGIRDVKWPGRMEMYKKNPRFLLDGAHNIDAIRYLRSNLKKYYDYKKLYIITGMLSDKDIDQMVEVIADEAEEIITLEPKNQRAADNDTLREKISRYNPNVKSMEDYEEAVREFLHKADEDDMILATGSFYLIGDIRRILSK